MSKDELRERYNKLKIEHRNLDKKIALLLEKPYLLPEEEIEVEKLKRIKLKLKEEIYKIKEELDS